MYADVTDWCLSYISGFISGESAAGAYSIAVGSGSRMSVGTALQSEISGAGLARGEGSTAWLLPLLTTTLTLTAPEDTHLQEFGVFQGTNMMYRGVLPVPIVVLKGQTITISGALKISRSSTDSLSFVTGSFHSDQFNYTLTQFLDISATISYSLGSTLNLPCSEIMCFSGKPLRNPSITKLTQAKGGRVWDIECTTLDYSDITSLGVVTAPGQVSTTIEGYQFASSNIAKGTFRIWDKKTQSYEVIPNCLLFGPISIEEFGENFIYSFTIAESYTGDI